MVIDQDVFVAKKLFQVILIGAIKVNRINQSKGNLFFIELFLELPNLRPDA